MGGTEPAAACCCYHYPTAGVEMYVCGLSKADAQSGADEAASTYDSAHWCCDSCPTSVLLCIPYFVIKKPLWLLYIC